MAESAAKERYVIDEEGNRVAVLVPLDEYERLASALEELESIRAYDAAKASDDEAIPLEQALARSSLMTQMPR